MALSASVQILGPEEKGRRRSRTSTSVCEVADRETVLEAHEIVTHDHRAAPGERRADDHHKFGERDPTTSRSGRAAISLRVEAGTIAEARVAPGGVAPRPWHSPETEAALVGKPMKAETWKAAGEAAVADAVPLDMNGYKLHLVKGILHRALESLA